MQEAVRARKSSVLQLKVKGTVFYDRSCWSCCRTTEEAGKLRFLKLLVNEELKQEILKLLSD
jgi:hypothetical protein